MNEPKPMASELIISLILLHDSANILEKETEIFLLLSENETHNKEYILYIKLVNSENFPNVNHRQKNLLPWYIPNQHPITIFVLIGWHVFNPISRVHEFPLIHQMITCNHG